MPRILPTAPLSCTWRHLACGVIALLAILFHYRNLTDPLDFNGDARQHVFWTYRFRDPGLFPDDPLVRFISGPRFDPPGYTAVYAVGARLIDPLWFSKILGFALSIATGILAWRLGRRLGGKRAGFLLVLLLGIILFDRQRGGLPRSFAFPILLLHLEALASRVAWRGGLSLLLAALFYPPIILLMATLTPLWFLRGRHGAPGVGGRGVLVGLPFALAAVGVLAYSYLLTDREFTGPMVSEATARAMPEFQPGGRTPFFYPDPVRYWLGAWGTDRSACHLFDSKVFYGFVGALLLLGLRRRRFRAPAELVGLFAAGLVLFLAAHAVLFALFQPSRFPRYGWPVALLGLVAVNLASLLAPWLERGRRRLSGRRGLVAFTVLLAAIVIGKELGARDDPSPGRARVIEIVSGLPKDVVIAGVPRQLDDIPLLARRSVFVNQELSLPWYEGYYALVRGRLEVTLSLLMAREAAEVRRLSERHGVTHLLIDLELYAGEKRAFTEPWQGMYRELRAAPGPPLFSRPDHGFEELYRDARRLLLAL